jgi:AraC-like DNA-binding protein
MEYVKTPLESRVKIDGVYTVHYFEYTKDFAYSGEIHNFWEIVYADKKRLYITAGAKEICLEVGQLYIHKPNEFHNLRCEHAANSVIVSFDCDCPELISIAGMVITCGSDERRLIGGIVKESLEAFSTPLGMPYTRVMEKSGGGSFCCEQMVRLYIEQLLILLVRGNRRTVPLKRAENGCLLAKICEYLEKNVQSRLHFEDIMHEFNLSASVIKKLFREQMDCGVMEYFARLKVDAAKQMIREGNYNFTEIAAALSFNTSQYFTTVFRRVSGMTPTEYSLSVRTNLNE